MSQNHLWSITNLFFRINGVELLTPSSFCVEICRLRYRRQNRCILKRKKLRQLALGHLEIRWSENVELSRSIVRNYRLNGFPANNFTLMAALRIRSFWIFLCRVCLRLLNFIPFIFDISAKKSSIDSPLYSNNLSCWSLNGLIHF